MPINGEEPWRSQLGCVAAAQHHGYPVETVHRPLLSERVLMASALRKPTIVRPIAVHKPTVLKQTAATRIEPAILPFGDDVRDVLGLTFEDGAQHRKGLDTEDSMLRIASAFGKKVKGVIRQRVWPPREFSRGREPIRADGCGRNSRIVSASPTPRPRMRSSTSRTLRPDMG